MRALFVTSHAHAAAGKRHSKETPSLIWCYGACSFAICSCKKLVTTRGSQCIVAASCSASICNCLSRNVKRRWMWIRFLSLIAISAIFLFFFPLQNLASLIDLLLVVARFCAGLRGSGCVVSRSAPDSVLKCSVQLPSVKSHGWRHHAQFHMRPYIWMHVYYTFRMYTLPLKECIIFCVYRMEQINFTGKQT